MALPVYVEWEWWLRWYVVLNITDEGTFGEDQVPEDYGGPILKIEQNTILYVVTRAGYMQRMSVFMGADKVQDNTRKKGVGFAIEPFEDLLEYDQIEPVGPSDVYLPMYLQERPDETFTDEEKTVYRELLRATILHQ